MTSIDAAVRWLAWTGTARLTSAPTPSTPPTLPETPHERTILFPETGAPRGDDGSHRVAGRQRPRSGPPPARRLQADQAAAGPVIVGQNEVIEELLIALFSRGHCLLEGVPGLAKTLMISTLAEVPVARLQPHPVHARPDAVRHHRHRGHRGEPHRPATASSSSSHGPLFANVILADEINRTPPKTQAALLEAMQERQVTVGRVRHRAAPIRSSCWPRRTRSSRKAPIRCPRPSRTASCSRSSSSIPSFKEEFEIARRTTTLDQRGDHAGADRRADPGAAAAGARGAGDRPRHPLHAGPGAADARRRAGRAEVHHATGCPGAPARARCST